MTVILLAGWVQVLVRDGYQHRQTHPQVLISEKIRTCTQSKRVLSVQINMVRMNTCGMYCHSYSYMIDPYLSIVCG